MLEKIQRRFPNHLQIIRLAIPIILANLSAPLLGLVDTATIGQTGVAAELGGVALATVLFNFVYWAFAFLRMGTTGFIAQAQGASDREEILAVLYRSLLLGVSIGLVLILFQHPIERTALWLLSGSEEVEGFVSDYYRIRIWGAPATLITYALLGTLIGMGWTRELMWVQLQLNGLNILLNIWFVLGLGMGIRGIALGTLLSEIAAMIFAWHLMRRNLKLAHPWQRLKELWSRILNRERIVALIRVNRDIMLRTLALLGGFTWFADYGARLGDATLAANHVLLQFVTMSAFFLDGYAHVVEMLSGKSIGARDRSEFIRQMRDSSQLAGGTALLLGVGIILAGPLAIPLLVQDTQVIEIARQHVHWAGIYIFFSFAAFQLDGLFIGATRSREMRNAMILSFLILIGAGTLLTARFGNTGLWISFTLFVIARGATMAAYFPALLRELFPSPS